MLYRRPPPVRVGQRPAAWSPGADGPPPLTAGRWRRRRGTRRGLHVSGMVGREAAWPCWREGTGLRPVRGEMGRRRRGPRGLGHRPGARLGQRPSATRPPDRVGTGRPGPRAQGERPGNAADGLESAIQSHSSSAAALPGISRPERARGRPAAAPAPGPRSAGPGGRPPRRATGPAQCRAGAARRPGAVGRATAWLAGRPPRKNPRLGKTLPSSSSSSSYRERLQGEGHGLMAFVLPLARTAARVAGSGVRREGHRTP